MKDFNLINELRLSGVSWEEIKESVDWFTDNDRKVYAGWLLGQEESNNADILKFAKQRQTIRIERKILGVERSISNEQVRDIALHGVFTDQVMSAISNKYTDFQIKDLNLDIKQFVKGSIFTVSDFHYNGDSSYLQVLKRATEQIIKVIMEKQLTRIYLVELGDVIDGASLRTSQLMAIKSGMVSQVVEVADAYIKMITTLSEYAKVTFISVDSSNHTQLRNLGTKQNQLIEEDLMIIFNKIIQTALPSLEFYHDEDIVVDILGFNCFFSHGHLVKNKEKYIETLQANRNVRIDYAWFGHFHHQRTIDLHSANGYDKKVFYVPALNTIESSYESDKNLSSLAGVGYYELEAQKGHVETRKLVV